MTRIVFTGMLVLGLTAGCTSTSERKNGPEVSGSERIVAEGHDVLAYVTVGGVT